MLTTVLENRTLNLAQVDEANLARVQRADLAREVCQGREDLCVRLIVKVKAPESWVGGDLGGDRPESHVRAIHTVDSSNRGHSGDNLQAVLGRKLDLLEHTRLPVQSGAVSTQRLKHYTEVCSGVCEQKHRVVSLSQGVVAWHLDRVLS
jgi:hypothetical protein